MDSYRTGMLFALVGVIVIGVQLASVLNEDEETVSDQMSIVVDKLNLAANDVEDAIPTADIDLAFEWTDLREDLRTALVDTAYGVAPNMDGTQSRMSSFGVRFLASGGVSREQVWNAYVDAFEVAHAAAGRISTPDPRS